MSELQSHEPGFESPLAQELGKIRPQIRVVADSTQPLSEEAHEDALPQPTQAVRREEREQKENLRFAEKEPREAVLRVVENDKGEMTISVPPAMEEAKKIAAEVPRAQRAATRQKYTSMIADIAITTLMVAGSAVLVAFAAKGLTSSRED
jgi:hypothetical protein